MGIQFLRHLARTRLLLHLVDIAPLDDQVSPVEAVRSIIAELEKYGADLAQRERWLVLTKTDLLDPAEFVARRDRLVRELGWQGPVYGVSAISGAGLEPLMQALMSRLEALRADEQVASAAPAEQEPYDPTRT